MSEFDIVAEIERLKAESPGEFKELQAVVAEQFNPWVSVDDRLPEAGVKVLVFGGKHLGCAMITRSISKIFKSCESGCFVPPSIVTHWMPLPSAPRVL